MADKEGTEMPSKKKIELAAGWVVGGGLLLLVIGTGLGLFMRAHRVISYPQLQDGDPPVTVGDSSFDANSESGWAPGTNDTVLIPNGVTTPSGTLVNECGLTGLGLVQFYDGTKPWDVSPQTGSPLALTILHGGRPITAATDANHQNLTITDPNKGWGPPGHFTNKVTDKYPDHINVVQYVDANGKQATIPAKGGNTLARVDFCYK